jgi:hypothetical protein
MKLDEKIELKNLVKKLKGISAGTLITAIAGLSVDQQRTLQLLVNTALRMVGEDKKPIKMKSLIEKTIGKVSQKINVVIQLDKTKHASQRQQRHEKEITDTEIKYLAEKAIKRIGYMLMMDEIDINDKVIIQDTKTDLNLVGAIKRQGDMLDLVIITVMREKNFRNPHGTKVIKI